MCSLNSVCVQFTDSYVNLPVVQNNQSIDLIKLNFQTTSLEPPFYTPWFDGPKSTVQRAQKGVHSKEDAICEW